MSFFLSIHQHSGIQFYIIKEMQNPLSKFLHFPGYDLAFMLVLVMNFRTLEFELNFAFRYLLNFCDVFKLSLFVTNVIMNGSFAFHFISS